MKLFTLTLLLLAIFLTNAGEVGRNFLKSDANSDLKIPEHLPTSFMFLAQEEDFGIAFTILVDGYGGKLAFTPIDKDKRTLEVIIDFYNDKYYYHYLDENCCELYHYHFGIDNLTEFLDEAWQNKTVLVDDQVTKVYEVFLGHGLFSFEVTYTNYVLTEILTKDQEDPFNDFKSGMLTDIVPHDIWFPHKFIPSACYSPEKECYGYDYSNLFFKR